MFKKIVFAIVALAIFGTHLIFSVVNISGMADMTNSILLAILVVVIGILFSIKD